MRLIDVELVAQMVHELVGLAEETDRGGGSNVGGDEEIGKVFIGDFASDGMVVARGAGRFEDGLVLWGKPSKFEKRAFHVRVGGAKVVNGGVQFGDSGE